MWYVIVVYIDFEGKRRYVRNWSNDGDLRLILAEFTENEKIESILVMPGDGE